MRIEISAEAESDLEAIADHIALDNPTRAISFLRELRVKCMDLASMAEAFPLVLRYAALGVHRRVHGSYLIFYRVEAEQVVILHVVHGTMDYASVLFPEVDGTD